MLQSPIFHVNGEDPEAVAQAVGLAMDFRREFRRDVVIDMYCYRRMGHNEGDEPSFTQPLMYKAIRERKPVREGYLEHLLKLQEVTQDEAGEIAAERQNYLEEQLSMSTTELHQAVAESPRGVWAGYSGGPESPDEADTALSVGRASALLEALSRYPDHFRPHPRIDAGLRQRLQMARGERPLDWSAGEALALASLAIEGVRIRLSGQDSERGTFSQRHAVLHDAENGAVYVPLQHAAEQQAPVEILNSPLSEAAVLGFEYGYSLDCPDGLVIWEAQFGDFWNMAQMMVDQFIAAAEDKWRRLSGITLLLPHGFEGSGPEHSSARLERFLELAAEDNLQIVQPTSPAQFFHCLRRQVLRRWRKPLIVMTPKSLLRHPRVTSTLEELESGRFRRILPDTRETPRSTRCILLCSGKIYFELEKERVRQQQTEIAILRAEQLYPLPDVTISAALKPYSEGTPVRWVQEEPANMGAWPYWRFRFANRLCGRFPLEGVTRPASASPATGSHSSHKREQEELILKALSLEGV
jgi:2-oxoglutarate dehydrogenase E1 component